MQKKLFSNFDELKKIKIIFAEDNPDNFLLLKTILQDLGFNNVKGYGNGKELIERFKLDDTIDLVILDIQMPIMTGHECLKEIRKIEKNIPVIALTAFTLTEDRNRYLRSGFTGYITKPFTDQELLNEIFKVFNFKQN